MVLATQAAKIRTGNTHLCRIFVVDHLDYQTHLGYDF